MTESNVAIRPCGLSEMGDLSVTSAPNIESTTSGETVWGAKIHTFRQRPVMSVTPGGRFSEHTLCLASHPTNARGVAVGVWSR